MYKGRPEAGALATGRRLPCTEFEPPYAGLISNAAQKQKNTLPWGAAQHTKDEEPSVRMALRLERKKIMNKPVVRKVRLSVPAASGLCPAAPSPDGSGFARPAHGGLHPQREHDLHNLHEVGDLLLREAG